MATHVKLSKRERAAQLPFAGRVHKWRRVWVAAKATKINVRLIKWVKTGALVCAGIPPPSLFVSLPEPSVLLPGPVICPAACFFFVV